MSTDRKWPFEYPDEDECLLRILPSADMPGWFLVRTECGCVRVPPSELRSVVAALYEACGLRAPVILDRPEHPGASYEFEGVTYTIRPGRGIDVTRPTRSGQCGTLYEPAAIRRIASVLAALADEAEAGADPQDVAELAEEIRGAFGGGTSTLDAYDIAARTALRWMKDRQHRGGNGNG